VGIVTKPKLLKGLLIEQFFKPISYNKSHIILFKEGVLGGTNERPVNPLFRKTYRTHFGPWEMKLEALKNV
jgi:hypothetical protein